MNDIMVKRREFVGMPLAIRRFSGRLAAVLVLFSVVLGSRAAAFDDVLADDWFYPYVTTLAENGYVVGRETGLYDPRGTLSKAEAATMVVRYLGLEKTAAEWAHAITDAGHDGYALWYTPYIQIMYEAGIVTPETDDFAVIDGLAAITNAEYWQTPIKRYEFAVFVTRSFDISSGSLRTDTALDESGVGQGFTVPYTYDERTVNAYADKIKDYDAIPEDAREDVLRAYMNGIFAGDDSGSFHPQNTLSRAEMAKVICVVLHKDMRIWLEVGMETNADETEPVNADETEPGNADETEPVNADETEPGNADETEPVNADETAVTDREGLKELLNKNIDGFAVTSSGKDGYSVSFRPVAPLPDGAVLTLYHYVDAGNGYTTDLATSVHNRADTGYSCPLYGGDRIILAAEDAATGETLAAVLLRHGTDGKLLTSSIDYEYPE